MSYRGLSVANSHTHAHTKNSFSQIDGKVLKKVSNDDVIVLKELLRELFIFHSGLWREVSFGSESFD
jgi:hypothetical protein